MHLWKVPQDFERKAVLGALVENADGGEGDGQLRPGRRHHKVGGVEQKRLWQMMGSSDLELVESRLTSAVRGHSAPGAICDRWRTYTATANTIAILILVLGLGGSSGVPGTDGRQRCYPDAAACAEIPLTPQMPQSPAPTRNGETLLSARLSCNQKKELLYAAC